MQRLLRDIGSYARALWNEWVVLTTGGSIIAVIFGWEKLNGKSISTDVGLIVVNVTLLIASFTVWRYNRPEDDRTFIDIKSRRPIPKDLWTHEFSSLGD